MPDSDYLYFEAHFEPRESTAGWYREVLYQLWRHGMSFALDWRRGLTWEETLEYHPEFAIAGNGAAQPQRASRPLAQWIEEAAMNGSLTLDVYDNGLRLLLTLEPRGRRSSREPDALKTLGRLKITYDRVYLNTDHDDPHDILPRSQQTWVAHIHWAEICCMLLKPLYEISYQQADVVPYEVIYRGRDRSERLEQEEPLLKMLKKVREKLSVNVPRLVRTRLQYFSPQLLTEGEEQSLQRHPYVFSEYLPTGGLMVIPRAEPFYYGFGIAHTFLNRAREVYEHAEQEGDEADREGDRLSERGNALLDVYRELLRG